MNIEEAIVFLKIEYDNINPDFPLSAKTWQEKKDRYNEIIKLLKRGEKFEKMWKELEKIKCLIVEFDNEGYHKDNHFLSEIKQKYFPKGD